MRKVLFLFVFVCLFSLEAVANVENVIGADSFLSKFVNGLGNETKVADFVQTKTFLKYNKSFVVAGDVKFVKDVGLLWRQKTPKKFYFTATKENYCVDNGLPIDVSTLPYMKKIKNVVDDVVSSGDFSKIYDTFFVKYSEDENTKTWRLELLPKFSKISNVIKRISLSGGTENLLDFSMEYLNGILIAVVFEDLKGEVADEIKC